MLLSVRGAEQLRDLSRDLQATGNKGLQRDLRRDIAAAMKPMRTAVQTHVRAIPTHGTRHTGLRDDVAKATTIRVLASSRAQVLLEIMPRKMPEGKRKLPAYLDGRGRWRHPVFGNREVWVTQPGHPYFWRSVEPHIQDVRKAVVKAVEHAIDRYIDSR